MVQSQAIDVINPPARTELELWQRWLNRMQAKWHTQNPDRKIIEVREC